MSRVISSSCCVAREHLEFLMWIEVYRSSETTRSEMRIESSKL
ncbi:MAG: hypothetical protein R3E48_10530 [Burkholderiaceae bacterium]